VGSLILALRFLTVVPVPGPHAGAGEALGRAAWWFPAVGLALGAALVVVDRGLAQVFRPFLAAALVVLVWKALTGLIHLDGLADCLDGLAGRDAERRLAIMRDSRVGVFGAGGIAGCLLVAAAALSGLSPAARVTALLAAPALGRIAPALGGACFGVATPGQGSGDAFLRGLSRWAGPIWLVVAAAITATLLGPMSLTVVAAAAAGALLWCAWLARRLGGLTGDVLGGAVEVAELAALLAVAALAERRLI
jgi:adenosylcobinamide-GDP ribazoletransferase